MLRHFALPPGLQLRQLSGGTAPYAALGSAFAVAMFPHAFELLAFMELYALAVPILVPDLPLMLKIERLTTFPAASAELFSMRDAVFGDELAGGTPPGHAYAPYWAHRDGAMGVPAAHFEHWWGLSYFTLLPHVSEFASMPDLVARLGALDRRAVASAMRREHADLAQASVAAMVETLRELLA